MISLDLKNETTSSASSPLGLSIPSDKSTISFSDLLRGASEKKDTKTIQNGALVLALVDEKAGDIDTKVTSKGDLLLSLLKNENSLTKKEQPLELNPKITSTLTTKEIKTLILDAKNYLKTKIQDSDDFKHSMIKDLPKTLKGLVQVAKNFGIDISKISIEEVKAHAKTKNEIIEDIKTSDIKESLKDKKSVASDIKEIVEVKKAEIKEVVQKKPVASDIKEIVEVKKAETKELIQDKKAITSDIKELAQDKKVQTAHIKENIAKPTQISQNEQVQEIKNDEKFVKVQKEVKATPLFKAQTATEHTTTEQIVQAKVNSLVKVAQKTPKEKADETLKLLLRGEKPSIKSSALTADFSVATAKVIAPTATSDIAKSFEALLRGDTTENNGSSSKVDALLVNKADSFEVKLNEAKQMIKYLSNDVKSAIEDYKSPFTRVKIQLNPQKLGEVDLTIVQRGKNLHVNISSNTTAISTLAANVNELRVQLSNSGINNASLNFNNSSQNSDTNAGHQNQQHRQNEKDAHEEYNYLQSEELNEEILSSLEIVVPYYA